MNVSVRDYPRITWTLATLQASNLAPITAERADQK